MCINWNVEVLEHWIHENDFQVHVTNTEDALELQNLLLSLGFSIPQDMKVAPLRFPYYAIRSKKSNCIGGNFNDYGRLFTYEYIEFVRQFSYLFDAPYDENIRIDSALI